MSTIGILLLDNDRALRADWRKLDYIQLGDAWVRVQAILDYGMAAIWDADILIWAAPTLNRMKQQGRNDLPQTLTTTAYNLLRAIKRSTGGWDYQTLQAARLRPRTTSTTTSIGSPFDLATVRHARQKEKGPRADA